MVPDSWGRVMNKAVVITLPLLALPYFMLINMHFLPCTLFPPHWVTVIQKYSGPSHNQLPLYMLVPLSRTCFLIRNFSSAIPSMNCVCVSISRIFLLPCLSCSRIKRWLQAHILERNTPNLNCHYFVVVVAELEQLI